MDVFDLMATLSLDTSGYETGLRNAKLMASGATDGLQQVDQTTRDAENSFDNAGAKASFLGNMLATVVTKGAELAFDAIGKVSSAAVALVKDSVGAYASFEQLTGGVETLFKDSADIVEGYAADAYKTAGLSANDYMETVTSFSASLLQSLNGDTAAAAETANRAIIDMSDNANKMGTNIGSIQNAYQGFAKQNYTMLDNLKLGYGGTKEEMERLLADAEKLSGQEYDISSYADIVDAIHVVQEEMGITGTTAEEASTTIEGSAQSMKAAWNNLLVGLADGNQEIGPLFDKFIESAETAAGNLIPRIEETINGITNLAGEIGPILVEKIPEVVATVTPGIISAIMSLAEAGVSMLPTLISTALDIFLQVLNALTVQMPTLIPVIVGAVVLIAQTLVDHLPEIIDAALQLIVALSQGMVDALPILIDAVPQLIIGLLDAFAQSEFQILGAALQIVEVLALGLVAAMPSLITGAVNLFTGLIEWIATFTTQEFPAIGSQIAAGLLEGLEAGWTAVQTNFTEKIGGLVEGAKSLLGIHSPSRVFAQMGGYMAEGLEEGWSDEIGAVRDNIEGGLDFGEATLNASANIGTSGTLAGAGAGAGQFVIPIYIGSELLDEYVIDAQNRNAYRSGGR